MTTQINKLLHGIIPPMITPLNEDQTLDEQGLARLIEHILGGSVHGLFILGTTGEGPGLSYEVRRHLIRATVEQVNNRVPVLVGITDTSFFDSVDLADYASHTGATAVVSGTPYYFKSAQHELLDYMDQLNKAVSLPLVLYNIPQLTKVHFEPETVKQILQWENVIGIKDSSGNLDYFQQLSDIISERPEWSLLMGSEEHLSHAVHMGADGAVCGGANLFPHLFVELYAAVLANETKQGEALREEIACFNQLLYTVGKHDSSAMKGIKGTLACLGICEDHMALPYKRLSEAERKKLQQHLEQFFRRDTASKHCTGIVNL